MKRLITICLAVVLLGTGYVMAGTWTTLDMPGAYRTLANGIDGSNIVGQYDDTSGEHGFLYNGSSWTTFNYPGATETVAGAINGKNIVGGYKTPNASDSHAFLYDGTTWTTLPDMAGSIQWREALGISGNKIVGQYVDSDRSWKAFLYDGTSMTTFDYPGAISTGACGIEGDNIVGCYDVGSGWRGYLYNGTTWTNLPVAPGSNGTTIPCAISGSNIVGYDYDGSGHAHGWLYNGTGFTILDMPGATGTSIQGISGNSLVGVYSDASGDHGFIYTIPEPATLLLLGLGGLAMMRKRRT